MSVMKLFNILLGGAATCSEGFVICFLKVPLASLSSMAAAVQPNSLGTLSKHFTKPSEQVAAPPSMYHVTHLTDGSTMHRMSMAKKGIEFAVTDAFNHPVVSLIKVRCCVNLDLIKLELN